MEMRCVWIMFIVLMAMTVQKTKSARVVLLRDTIDSSSQEESRDSLSEEESEEIDFLMDLIQNEAKDREPPPVTTVRVIKKITEQPAYQTEQFSQNSYKKERHEPHPNSFKEYHIHYHNHHHKERVPKPPTAFDDSPYTWTPQFPPTDFNDFRQKPHLMPYYEGERSKGYKDVDTFFKTLPRHPYPPAENDDPKVRLEAFKDFETFIKPRIPNHKSKTETPYERITKFQEYFDSDEERHTVSNKDRFAGFKDFSELEDADKSKNEEKENKENMDKKTVKIKDFAIVIKSRPRKNHYEKKLVVENDDKNVSDEEGGSPGPQIPPLVNKLRIPPYVLPRLIDAAGGVPKYIEELNQLKYHQHHAKFPMLPLHPNALGGERRKLFHLRHPFMHPHHHHHHHHLPPPPSPMFPYPPPRNNFNGWLRRRLMR